MVDHTEDYDGFRESFLLSGRARGPRLRRRRGSRLRRLLLTAFTFVLSLGMVVACALGYLFFRPGHEPIQLGLQSQVESALSYRVGHGFRFAVGGTEVDWVDNQPALIIRDLAVADSAGRSVIRAPHAILAVDPLRLVTGVVVPTRLALRDLTVRLTILTDGSLAFSAGTDVTVPFRVAEAFDSPAPGPEKSAASATPPLVVTPEKPEALGEVGRVLADVIDKLSGADNGFGGFDRLGIRGGTFVLDDRSRNTVTTFRNIEFDFDKVAEGATKVSLAADGAAGRWSASVRGAKLDDGRRSLALNVDNVTLAELQSIPRFAAPGFDSDLPLSANVDIGLDAAGSLAVMRGGVRTGAGFFRLDDPDHEPVMVDAIHADVHFDAASRKFIVDPSKIDVEATHYAFHGDVTPPAGLLTDPWRFDGGGSGIFGPERPGEQPIDLRTIKLDGQFDPGAQLLHIAELSLNGPQVAVGLAADIQDGPDGPTVKAKLNAGRMPAANILRLWPNLLSAQVRAWLLQNVRGGTIERGSALVSLDEDDLKKIRAMRSVADSHLHLDYAVSDMSMTVMDGLPPLHDIVGTGVVTGDTSNFRVSHAVMDLSSGHQLVMPDGGIAVPSTDPKPTPAVISARVSGSVESLMDLLSRDALKSYVDLPSDISSAKGQVDGSLSIGLKLGQKVRSEDLKVNATARLQALAIDKVVGKQGLSNGDIVVALDKTGLRAKGGATLFGAQSTIDIRKPAGTDPGEAEVMAVLDDAARAKAGIDLGKSVTGPITAKVSAPIGTSDHKATIELDLSRATLNEPLPGLTKPNGRPGKVTLTAAQSDNGVTLDNIACDIGSASIRGSASLDSNGALQSARLSQFKLSPGDDMKVEATRAGDGLKLSVKGANVDARPFLKSLTSSGGPDPNSKDIDLDLHSNVVTGQNSLVMTGVDLHLARRNGQVKKLQASGRFGRSPFSVTSNQQGAVTSLYARSGDAGATLAFLDLYKRLSGGQLEATLRMMDNRIDGYATIHDFGLREDPAMKRLTEESLSQSKQSSQHIDASNLTFTKLSLNFTKNGSRVDLKDGALFGPELGATVQGTIDLDRDRVALSGTFVPIYGVNNLFAQLPVVGTILGGDVHEGLFGLNYKISGSTNDPNLTVDPLSALAPGFLRKIFGAISDATDQNNPLAPHSGTAPGGGQ